MKLRITPDNEMLMQHLLKICMQGTNYMYKWKLGQNFDFDTAEIRITMRFMEMLVRLCGSNAATITVTSPGIPKDAADISPKFWEELRSLHYDFCGRHSYIGAWDRCYCIMSSYETLEKLSQKAISLIK